MDYDDGDDYDDDKVVMDKIMDASNIIQSMRSAVGDQLRHLEPPMPLFTRPRQRQEWGDVQETPHKEWGDIFFDLVRDRVLLLLPFALLFFSMLVSFSGLICILGLFHLLMHPFLLFLSLLFHRCSVLRCRGV